MLRCSSRVGRRSEQRTWFSYSENAERPRGCLRLRTSPFSYGSNVARRSHPPPRSNFQFRRYRKLTFPRGTSHRHRQVPQPPARAGQGRAGQGAERKARSSAQPPPSAPAAARRRGAPAAFAPREASPRGSPERRSHPGTGRRRGEEEEKPRGAWLCAGGPGPTARTHRRPRR